MVAPESSQQIGPININVFDSAKDAKIAAQACFSSAITDNGADLLLLSGGSVTPIIIATLQGLNSDVKQLISIAQVDERYGPVGHADSNWQKLLDAGLMPEEFKSYASALECGETTAEIHTNYSARLRDELDESGYSVGIFGLGADGHTSGMLPVDTETFDQFLGADLVAIYDGPDFQRITTTHQLINQLGEIVIFAGGEAKLAAVEKLQQDLPVHEHPAQLLKKAKKVTLFYGKD